MGMNFWHDVLSIVEKRLNRQIFETWFGPVVYHGCENGMLRLAVPTESFKNCLIENYSGLLLESAAEAGRSSLNLQVSVAAASATEPPIRNAAPIQDSLPSPVLIPKYTFDSFVVGTSNQLARAAALAVAERPSKAYNPLYLYGGVGLGKTHLMHAVGNLIQKRNPGIRLTYMSSETFMNELVNAIRFDRTTQFRQRYRNIDVLLMDDIQFIAGKERTQEEFFHTFNALYDGQKQIVISSDCAPKQIPTLEERLHSRFQWGLIADIQPPDLETKLAILNKKAESVSFNLRTDVAIFIAQGIRSNVRELEGALNQLCARASLDHLKEADIDLSYAMEVFKGFAATESSAISPDAVLRAVASFFALKPAQLKSKNNSPSIALPRQIAMYICKELTHHSLPQIGREFGNKHHTTVLHSIRKIRSMKNKDKEVTKAVNEIVKSLR